MVPHSPRASRSGFAALAAFLAAASISRAQDSPGSKPGTPAFHRAGRNPIVRMAVSQAYSRLGEPGCRELFSEFEDAEGRLLQERLDVIGQTGQSYLERIWFVNAGFGGRCAESGISAFTSPGSQVVYFCGGRFTRAIKRRGIGFLAAVVIHEELHSLGLGENPPSSLEITRRVESRCGF